MLLVIVTLGGANITYGQSNYLTCAWERAVLHKAANKNAGFVESLNFGDKVSPLQAEEVYVPAEERTYVKVESPNQKVGWIEKSLFVSNAIPAVLLESTHIYERPNTPSSITLKKLESLEIVLRGKHKTGWIYITSKNKEKIGWIRSDVNYSQTSKDLKYAREWAEIQDQAFASRKDKAVNLVQEARENGSALADIFLKQDEDIALELAEKSRRANARLTNVKSLTRDKAPEEKTEPGKVEQKLIWSRVENAYFTEIVETGPAIPVEKAIEFTTPFYAFHKTLPIGTEVKMDLPDNGGFVQLVIMGRLEQEAPAILALPPFCLSSIFGTTQPGDIVISYRKNTP